MSVRLAGWGPFPMPGEKKRLRRAGEVAARHMAHLAKALSQSSKGKVYITLEFDREDHADYLLSEIQANAVNTPGIAIEPGEFVPCIVVAVWSSEAS